MARALAEQGVQLALVDIREERLAEVGKEFQLSGFDSRCYACDVASLDEVQSTFGKILAEMESVQLLLNCAGVAHAGRFAESSIEDWEWLLGVNLWGTVYFTHALLPHLLEQPQAHIVNVCSSFAWIGFPGKSAYSASKFAVRGFSESLRMELRETSVGLTVLYPGPVDTNLVRDGRSKDPMQQEAEIQFLEKRSISPQRVARALLAGIRAGRHRVVVGADYRLIDLLCRLSPRLAQYLIGELGRRLFKGSPQRSG